MGWLPASLLVVQIVLAPAGAPTPEPAPESLIRVPAAAIQALQVATRYDLHTSGVGFIGRFGPLYPIYVRGLAYLEARQPAEAAGEFQRILDHRSVVLVDPMDAMARLQLARALALSGDTVRARGVYADLLTLWKHADPGIRVIEEARAEGRADLARAVGVTLQRSSRPGLLVVVSDFLDPGPVTRALTQARAAGHEVILIQVLAEEELAPRIDGDFSLEDAETGALIEVAVDASALEACSQRIRQRVMSAPFPVELDVVLPRRGGPLGAPFPPSPVAVRSSAFASLSASVRSRAGLPITPSSSSPCGPRRDRRRSASARTRRTCVRSCPR